MAAGLAGPPAPVFDPTERPKALAESPARPSMRACAAGAAPAQEGNPARFTGGRGGAAAPAAGKAGARKAALPATVKQKLLQSVRALRTNVRTLTLL